MPLILRCDAPSCAAETMVQSVILGRPQAPSGWWCSAIAGRGSGTAVIACPADGHLTAAATLLGTQPSRPETS